MIDDMFIREKSFPPFVNKDSSYEYRITNNEFFIIMCLRIQ